MIGRGAVRMVTAALVTSLTSGYAVAQTPDDYQMSPEGHAFRVRFDPESRIRLGIGESLGLGGVKDGAIAQAPEVTAGISYRQLESKGVGRDRTTWQIDHRFVSGWIHPVRRAAQPLRAFDATLYSVNALRHDELPSIVLPSSPPMSVAFPFDVGFETQLGQVSVPERLPVSTTDGGGAHVPRLRIGVSHAAMILDPWRSGVVGRSLQIAVGARYDIDVYGAPSLRTSKMVHRVAPMTATSLRFRTQSDDGLWLIDCEAEVVPHWTSESIWKVAAAGSARVERIVLALNDAPITAMLEGGYRLTPGTRDVGLTHDVRVSLGLSFNLALK